MMFLNLMLLGGAAAAVVPLIIHLLNRTRYKMLDWGAMHLLESALKINSRRMQWQAWLLLLLRIFIPVILALCLARPVLTAWRTAVGGNQHSVVFVIDNSLSMEAPADRVAKDASERSGQVPAADLKSAPSCFELAIDEAAKLIDRFGSSTEVTILTSGGGVVDQTGGATFDRQRALRRLRSIRVGAGGSAMSEALSAGMAQLRKAQQLRRHLIVLSDFQRSEWDGLTPDQLSTLKSANDVSDAPVEIIFIPVTPRGPDNLSVQIDRPAGASVVAHHQPLEVRVSVRNHGRTRLKNLPVVLSVDGNALASKNVEVAGDSQVFLVFTCQLQSLGSHLLSVAIDETAARRDAGESAIHVVTTDDTARWSVQVIEPVRIGIVTARPASSNSIDDATFLNLALSPYAVSLVGGSVNEETAGWAEAQGGADPIQCDIVGPDSIQDRWLSGLQALALTNIPTLDDATAARITEFVKRGGLLMIWPGEVLQTQWYNQRWGSGATEPLLPYDYAALSRPAGRSAAAQKILSQSYDHPALTLFNRSSNGRLDSVDIQTWFELVPIDAQRVRENKAKSTLNLLSLENGEPLLAERVVQRGRVMQWATSCGDRWSNLPLREVFVPLMQQLVLYGATATTPPLNLETGQTLTLNWFESPTSSDTPTASDAPKSDSEANSDVGSAGAGTTNAAVAAGNADQAKRSSESVDLLTPQGTRYRLASQQVGDRHTIQFAETRFPGAYQVTGQSAVASVGGQPLPSRSVGKSGATSGTISTATTTVAVGTRVDESILIPLSSGTLNATAQRLEAQIQPSGDAFWQAEVVKQTGREIWRWMLAALVICLFAELLLQQSLTRTPA